MIGTGTKPHKAVLHVTLAVDSEATLTHQTLMDSTKMETLTGTTNQIAPRCRLCWLCNRDKTITLLQPDPSLTTEKKLNLAELYTELTLVAAHPRGRSDVIQPDVAPVGWSPDALEDQVGGAGLSGYGDLALSPLVTLRLQSGPHRCAQVAASLRVKPVSRLILMKY